MSQASPAFYRWRSASPRKRGVLLQLPWLIRSGAFTTTPAPLHQSITHPPGALNLIDFICHWAVVLRMGPKTKSGYIHCKEEWLAHSCVVLVFLLISGPVIALSKAVKWEERYRDVKTFPDSNEKVERVLFLGRFLGKLRWRKNSESTATSPFPTPWLSTQVVHTMSSTDLLHY